MASNAFGSLFRTTTFGESHGKMVGVVIDGCPAGVEISEEEINSALKKRAPGSSPYTSPRKEPDQAMIVSGLFEGKSTGAPICILIENHDADSSKYDDIKHLLRPGHANFTYLEKYGVFDHRGGGRASARETAARVAAGAIARKLLLGEGIEIAAYVKQIGEITCQNVPNEVDALQQAVEKSAIFCPDESAERSMIRLIEEMIAAGDSIGGVVEMVATGLPVGLGDPIYDKLEACLAQGVMSLPAVKGFEVGSGFLAAKMRGSEHNDAFVSGSGGVTTATNFAGGTLGGISNGMPLIARAALKPASSIKVKKTTVDIHGDAAEFSIPEGSRHDPCVAIRAVPVLEAVLALVLADRLLKNRTCKV